jgi:hypothetical protein
MPKLTQKTGTEDSPKSSKSITLTPLISEHLFTQTYDLIIAPSLQGRAVTVITFKKAGVPFNLKHTILLASNTGQIPSSHLFVWFNFSAESDSTGLMLQVLMNIKRVHGERLAPHVTSVLNTILSKKVVTQGEFLAFFDFLAEDEKFNVTFVIKSLETAFANISQSQLLSLTENIYSHCKSYSNFIFLSNSDFQQFTKDPAHTFWGEVQSNIVWGEKFLYDEPSILLSSKSFQDKQSVKFAPKFVEKLAKYSFGDPTVVLYAFYQSLSSEDFIASLMSKTKIEEIYETLGCDYLDWRFNLIIGKMQAEEVKALKSENIENRYISKTGLLTKNNKLTYLNPLFEYFVKNRLKTSTRASTTEKSQLSSTELRGQELLVYNLLIAHTGEIVSKDKIAELIWGETWEQKYSDWALDKLISNLKKKLLQLENPAKLQTFKKLGVMLVPVEKTIQ